MRLFRDLSVHDRIVALTTLVCTLALLIGGGGFFVTEHFAARHALRLEIGSLADSVAAHAGAAVKSGDRGEVEKALQLLRPHFRVLAAAVYDPDGKVLVQYRAPAAAALPIPARQAPGQRFVERRLETFRFIPVSGEAPATLFISVDTIEMEEQRLRQIGVFASVMGISVVLSWLLAGRLARKVSQPLQRLARTVSDAAINASDAPRRGDELVQLIEGLDWMRAHIAAQETALRRAHDELMQRRRAEHEHDGFFSLSLDLMCVAGLAGEFRRVNPAFHEMLGFTIKELTGASLIELVHPEDRKGTQAQLAHLAAGGTVRDYELRLRRRDGTYRWLAWCAAPVPGKDYFFACGRDVTALKQAEQDAAREKARLQFIFESVAVGISLRITHADGRVTRLINDAHLQICSLTREQVNEPGIFKRITHPDDFARQEELIARMAKREIDRFSIDKRYLKPNGEVVWVTYSLQRHDYADGSCEELSTVVDITGLKRAQEDAAAERARFKFIFDSVPVGISLLLLDQERTHVVNPAHGRITGIPSARMTEPGIFERITHPEDYVRQRPLAEAYARGEIDHYTIEKRYVHADGRTVWASLTMRMFNDPNTGRRQSISTVVDISDLKAAQELTARQQARFKFIFDAVPVGFAWMLNRDLATRTVNPAHAAITSVPAEHCRDLERYVAVTHPDDREPQAKLLQRLHAGEIEQYQMEKRYCHPDGSVRWAALKVRMFFDPTTRETQEITTLIDITERKQAEAELAETHKQLLVTSRQAGMAEVATGVLHNVGNVLNSVNVSANLLATKLKQSKVDRVARLSELVQQNAATLPVFLSEDPRGRQIPAYLQALAQHLATEQGELVEEVASLQKNVGHIKDIVSMQQSYAKVCGVCESVSVVDLVEDAVRMNASGLNADDVRLVREFDSKPAVVTEKHKVLQILVNLLRNAVHACNESARAHKQMTVRVSSDSARVRIAVSDNGVGIAPENLTRIFAHGFTTRKHGHGFGLHSGALAARELGGSLCAQSDGPGCGATFVLELPYRVDGRS